MRINLYKNWRTIVTKAWSIRFMLIAGALSGCEVILPLFRDDLPRGVFALLSIVAVGGGFVSRLVAQKELPE